jgi:hypothetical protein
MLYVGISAEIDVKGSCDRIRSVVDVDRGHTVFACDLEPGILLACADCGSWCDREPRGLLRQMPQGQVSQRP